MSIFSNYSKTDKNPLMKNLFKINQTVEEEETKEEALKTSISSSGKDEYALESFNTDDGFEVEDYVPANVFRHLKHPSLDLFMNLLRHGPSSPLVDRNDFDQFTGEQWDAMETGHLMMLAASDGSIHPVTLMSKEDKQETKLVSVLDAGNIAFVPVAMCFHDQPEHHCKRWTPGLNSNHPAVAKELADHGLSVQALRLTSNPFFTYKRDKIYFCILTKYLNLFRNSSVPFNEAMLLTLQMRLMHFVAETCTVVSCV